MMLIFNHYSSFVDLFDERVLQKFSMKFLLKIWVSSFLIKSLMSFHSISLTFLIHELKFKKGDRIAIQSPNVFQYPVVLFGSY